MPAPRPTQSMRAPTGAVRQHSQGDRRGLQAAANGSFGRFGRLFPDLHGFVFSESLLAELAGSIIKPGDLGKPFNQADGDENRFIPAGYTYFGQFIDHDLTLNTTSIGEVEADPNATVNFRTAAFDLDSVFGGGPGSDPFLYTSGDRLLAGASDGFKEHDPSQPRDPGLDRLPLAVPGTGPVTSRHDHPRGPNERALIGDPRNDENVIVLQLHTGIAAFYNRIIDPASGIIPEATTGTERSFQARRITRHHYQWVVVNDFLKRILHPAVFADIEAGLYPRQFNAVGAPFPFMPIEFAGAAYRFGHSMVRPSYALNRFVGTDPDTNRVPIFDAAGDTSTIGDMRSFRPLPGFWGIDWGYFFGDLPGGAPDGFDGPLVQPSYRIDTQLAIGLKRLPDHLNEADANRQNLAFLNLLRGNTLRLPSAEQLHGRIPLPGAVVGSIPTLDWENIWSAGSHRAAPVGTPTGDDELDALRTRRREIGLRFRAAHGDHTPLWYYVLREAEWYGVSHDPADIRGGQHLGPLASAIIADTFIGLLDADADSYRKVPGWQPLPAIADEADFGLAQLLAWALQ